MAPPHTDAQVSAGIRQSPTGRHTKGTAIYAAGSNRNGIAGAEPGHRCRNYRNRSSSLIDLQGDWNDTLTSLRSCGRLHPRSVDNGLTNALSTGLRSAVQRHGTVFPPHHERRYHYRPDTDRTAGHHSTSVDGGVEVDWTLASTRGCRWPRNWT